MSVEGAGAVDPRCIEAAGPGEPAVGMGATAVPSTHLAGRPVTAATYGNHGCRCPGCTAAWAANARQRRRTGTAAKRAGRHDTTPAEVRVQCWCGAAFPHVPVERILEPLYCSPECDQLPALSREPKERT